MSNKLGAIRHYFKKTIVADLDEFICSVVPEGQMWWIESASAMNDTTDNTECQIYIKRGGSLFPVKQFLNLTVDVWDTKFIRLWFFPGESLVFKWINVAAADLVEFSYVGHRKID